MIGFLLLSTAFASDFGSEVEVGLGVRGTGGTTDKGTVVRAIGRTRTGPVTLEATAGYRIPGVPIESVTGTVHTLVDIAAIGSDSKNASFQFPVQQEVWSFDLLADWDFGGREDPVDGWSGGPRLLGGFSVRSVQHYFATYDSSRTEPPFTNLVIQEKSMVSGPALGAAIDAWLDGQYGVRFSFLNRMFFEDAPQYDPNVPVEDSLLVHYPTVSSNSL